MWNLRRHRYLPGRSAPDPGRAAARPPSATGREGNSRGASMARFAALGLVILVAAGCVAGPGVSGGPPPRCRKR
jgi:hypothetical protein